MDRKRAWMAAAISVFLVLLAVTTVVATSWGTSHTPLYIFRMEQVSSEMNFLPTEVNTFTYMAEKGYTLPWERVRGCFSAQPLGTCPATCSGTCSTCKMTEECCLTSPPGITCPSTCSNTCWSTCPVTCYSTCNYTCASTCDTCYLTNHCCLTSPPGITCPGTCDSTCWATCWETC
ncbi:MAG: hypothetical protein HXS48_02200 [Theionarchaea archaeon]|nr:hypothetical protein [Theionarchaea archaeon]